MELIEKYQITENGYHPFIIRDGWQVAQLNFMPEQVLENIHKLDVHYLTDEVFVLLKGKAVLIGAEVSDDNVSFRVERMQPNMTYNIPKGTWHNIALTKGCEIIIIEKSNTHIGDCEFFQLSKEEKTEMDRLVKEAMEERSFE